MEQNFTPDIETILENIRLNCIILSKAHKKRYLELKDTLKYYRLPVIILSSLNSVVSIGLQPFVEQEYISISTCILALTCGMIGSIELYFGINTQMETDLKSNTDYYILSTDIFKMLSLWNDNRNIDAKEFLEQCYSRYIKLYESSYVVISKMDDKLTPIPESLSPSLMLSDLKYRNSFDSTYGISEDTTFHVPEEIDYHDLEENIHHNPEETKSKDGDVELVEV